MIEWTSKTDRSDKTDESEEPPLITERANAKINLYLNVVSRRENGYHNLVSLMQTVSLCDLVSVDFQPSEHTSVRLSASGNGEMPTDCRNLAWRAAELFLTESGRRGEVRIHLEKHIPMAAGLAGGSTDAAAVLRAMNTLCGKPFSTQKLCTFGEKLGADVPFCVRGGSMLVTGIGEGLGEFLPMPQWNLLIARLGDGVSTPWAYGRLDEKFDGFRTPAPDDPRPGLLRRAMEEKDLSLCAENLYNIFEEAVPDAYPAVNTVKQTMTDHGAVCAMMSGSGPSVFGIFETDAAAGAACAALRELGADAFLCHPCGKYRSV